MARQKTAIAGGSTAKPMLPREPAIKMRDLAPLPSQEKEAREDKIRRRAYELYMQRGGQHGADLDDWYQAEREIREEEERAA